MPLRVLPKTRLERIHLLWLIIGIGNFAAFFAHVLLDGTSAFPGGGRFVDGHYLVHEHGKEIPFSEAGYFFSYWHGVIFVTIHIVCMVVGWRLGTRISQRTPPA